MIYNAKECEFMYTSPFKTRLSYYHNMGSENSPRWREISDKIQREKLELEREIERQQLLNQLSASRVRNVELETALAKLARDQDRLVLAERERILKRAQIAQATAALVQEANWAKSRMENEMRLARERYRFFPETTSSPSRQSDPSEPSNKAPVQSLFPTNPMPTEAPAKSQPPPINVPKSRMSATVSSTPSEKPSAVSQPAVPEAIPLVESELVASMSDQVQASVADAAAGMLDTTNQISEAVSASYTGMLTSFRGVLDSVPAIVSSEPEPVTPVPKIAPRSFEPTVKTEPNVVPEKPQTITLPAPPTPLTIKPPIETKTLLPPPKATSVTVGEFPGRPEIPSEGQAKVIQQRTKGQWTDANLHAQAGAVLQQLIIERDFTIQRNPKLMQRLYGLPGFDGIKPAVSATPVQPEWVAAADAWAESVSGSSPKNSAKAKSKIDPAIASLTGVDPNLNEEQVVGPEGDNPETRSLKQAEDNPVQDEKNSLDAKNKKKGCVIM